MSAAVPAAVKGVGTDVSLLRSLVEIAIAGLAAAVAATAWTAVFPSEDVLVPVLLSVAGATALTAVGRLLRLPGLIVAVLHLPAVALALRLIDLDAGHLASGLMHGWARVLDSTLPASPAPDQLVIAPLLSWAAGAAVGGFVARTRRPWIHFWPLIASLLVVRVLATRGDDGSILPAAGGVLAVAAVLTALRIHGVGYFDLRRLAPTAIAVGVGAIAGCTLIPGAAPFDLSSRRRPQRDEPPPVISPLALLKAAQQNKSPLFTAALTLRSTPPPSVKSLYVRLTVLDAYRAGDWVPLAAFQATGGRIPPTPSQAAATFEIDQHLTMGSLSGPWIPAADRAVDVAESPRPVQADPVTGTIVVKDGVQPGDRFLVRSRVPVADEASLLGSRGDPSLAAFATPINGTPVDLISRAKEWTEGNVSDFEKVASLQARFAATFTVDERAESGRSLTQLERFIEVTQAGTSEQFATAFVVMARAVGLPARVAVGFRLPLGATSEVAAKQMEAWPEVALAGLDGRPFGWVPFDPTPEDSRAPERQIPKPDDELAARLAAQVAAGQIPAPPVAPPVVQQEEQRSTWSRPLLALLGVTLLFVLGVPLLTAGRRRSRTWSRRRGMASFRVAGAWAESLEALQRRGLADQRTSTVSEAIADAGSLDGIGSSAAGHLSNIGDTLTRTLFVDPEGVTDADADAVWAEAVAICRLASRDCDLLDRVRAAYDLRPLMPR